MRGKRLFWVVYINLLIRGAKVKGQNYFTKSAVNYIKEVLLQNVFVCQKQTAQNFLIIVQITYTNKKDDILWESRKTVPIYSLLAINICLLSSLVYFSLFT